MVALPEEYFVSRWGSANIPIKLRGMSFQDYDSDVPVDKVNGTRKMALSAARSFTDNFMDHYVSKERANSGNFPESRDNIGKGMLFYGRNGTRKTTLAAITLMEVQRKHPFLKVYFIRFSDLKSAMTNTFDSEGSERKVKANAVLEAVRTRSLVVIDDIGQEYRTQSGFTESFFHELIRVRYDSALPTIITTNIDPESMRGVYGDSFESFQHDAFDSYPLLGKDTRL
jgi:DNA replication protein DnaC